MYRVQLKNFEGPLDLLLFFIKRDELNIYDIPISYITEQFLEYIRLMEELDLEVASEFILMASMLMSIKARMMIPKHDDQQEVDEQDPRFELVQRLLEYKRYKEMGSKMQGLAKEAQKHHYRGSNKADQVEKQASGEALQDVTMFDLMAAFKKVLADIRKQEAVHEVEKIQATIEEQTAFVLKQLRRHGRSSFRELCASLHNRIKVIVTFLAVLELLKEQQISLYMESEDPQSFYVDLKGVDELMDESLLNG
ncbi:MAG TPA: segregation/condensation protein A [Balneolaceae bacterium]|nr:segregation/condensation protein A [Balneolaceae bacterium]